MADIRLTVEDEIAQGKLSDLMRKIPKLAERPMMIAAQMVAGISQKEYLRGPRPDRLAVKTGRLRSSISTKVEVEGDMIVGHVGTNVVSTGGYNYPGYWENRGRNGKPRPFLKPARENHRNKWVGTFLREFKKELLNFLSRHK